MESRITILAVVTVLLFALAAIHNNDVFLGDSAILSSLRIDNEPWRQFFACYDLTAVVGVI